MADYVVEDLIYESVSINNLTRRVLGLYMRDQNESDMVCADHLQKCSDANISCQEGLGPPWEAENQNLQPPRTIRVAYCCLPNKWHWWGNRLRGANTKTPAPLRETRGENPECRALFPRLVWACFERYGYGSFWMDSGRFQYATTIVLFD